MGTLPGSPARTKAYSTSCYYTVAHSFNINSVKLEVWEYTWKLMLSLPCSPRLIYSQCESTGLLALKFHWRHCYLLWSRRDGLLSWATSAPLQMNLCCYFFCLKHFLTNPLPSRNAVYPPCPRPPATKCILQVSHGSWCLCWQLFWDTPL